MNSMIKILLEDIEHLEEVIKAKRGAIQEISATLNPQIPEPYASMSREEILGGIGQYDICNI